MQRRMFANDFLLQIEDLLDNIIFLLYSMSVYCIESWALTGAVLEREHSVVVKEKCLEVRLGLKAKLFHLLIVEHGVV